MQLPPRPLPMVTSGRTARPGSRLVTNRPTFCARIRAARPREQCYDVRDETVSGFGLRTGRPAVVLPAPQAADRQDALGYPRVGRFLERRRDTPGRMPGAATVLDIPQQGPAPLPGPADRRIRQGVSGAPCLRLEAEHAGGHRQTAASGHPAGLRPSHRGCGRGRERPGPVRLHGGSPRRRQPLDAGALGDDAHGRVVGLPPRQHQFLREHRALQDDAEGALPDGGRDAGSTRSSPTASSTVPGWSPSSGCCC